MSQFTLYDYWRSSAAYRVRIALNWKGLPYTSVPVNLLKGEQHTADYHNVNPEGAVPAMLADNQLLTQSLAIIEYLEEIHPKPTLLPKDPIARARARAMALLVAADIHPLVNLRVQQYVVNQLGQEEDEKFKWYQHWVGQGFRGLEKHAKAYGSGRFCIGDAPTIADLCLIPQMFGARRFKCDLAPYPTLLAIEKHCLSLPAFDKARPENQLDAVA